MWHCVSQAKQLCIRWCSWIKNCAYKSVNNFKTMALISVKLQKTDVMNLLKIITVEYLLFSEKSCVKGCLKLAPQKLNCWISNASSRKHRKTYLSLDKTQNISKNEANRTIRTYRKFVEDYFWIFSVKSLTAGMHFLFIQYIVL